MVISIAGVEYLASVLAKQGAVLTPSPVAAVVDQVSQQAHPKGCIRENPARDRIDRKDGERQSQNPVSFLRWPTGCLISQFSHSMPLGCSPPFGIRQIVYTVLQFRTSLF
jgi:hypothetical protein